MNTFFKIFSFSLTLLASTDLLSMEVSKRVPAVQVWFEAPLASDGLPTFRIGDKNRVTLNVAKGDQVLHSDYRFTDENKEYLYPCKIKKDEKYHCPLWDVSEFQSKSVEIRQLPNEMWKTSPSDGAKGVQQSSIVTLNCSGGVPPTVNPWAKVPECDGSPHLGRLKVKIFLRDERVIEIFSGLIWMDAPAKNEIKETFFFNPGEMKNHRVPVQKNSIAFLVEEEVKGLADYNLPPHWPRSAKTKDIDEDKKKKKTIFDTVKTRKRQRTINTPVRKEESESDSIAEDEDGDDEKKDPDFIPDLNIKIPE